MFSLEEKSIAFNFFDFLKLLRCSFLGYLRLIYTYFEHLNFIRKKAGRCELPRLMKVNNGLQDQLVLPGTFGKRGIVANLPTTNLTNW